MIEAATVVLTMIADGFIAALTSKISDKIAAKLRSDTAKQALRQAIGAAIQRYATAGTRLDLSAPLLQRDGFLTKPAVVEELAQIMQFNREPNYELIGDLWRSALEHPPIWRNFKEEARLLVGYLQAELRLSDVFRPVFDSHSLDLIADKAVLSSETLATIDAQIANLASMIDTRLGELVNIFETADSGIREQIRDFTRYIEEKTRGFVGRQFVFDSITTFTQQQPRGYMIIRGDPGIGKTALVAQLVKTGGHVHHFNVRAQGINRTDAFMRNICAQLIARYDLDLTYLPPEATQDAGFFSHLLEMVSNQITNDERIIIIVDALDEVDSLGISAGANTLLLPMILPHGIYIVATTRKIALNLRIDCEHQILDLEQDSHGNLADIRLYVDQIVARPGIQAYIAAQNIDSMQFVNLIIEKSQGNFMYLRYVIPEIERGAYKDFKLDSLPLGLRNYYEDHWKRMRGQDEGAWFSFKLPIIMALTAVEEPVSINLISAFSGVEQRPRIRSVLQDWQQFLYEELIDNLGETQKRYRIYHASFHDFIADKDEVSDERVSTKNAHKKIVDDLRSELYGSN